MVFASTLLTGIAGCTHGPSHTKLMQGHGSLIRMQEPRRTICLGVGRTGSFGNSVFQSFPESFSGIGFRDFVLKVIWP